MRAARFNLYYYAPDFNKSLAFYRDILGLEVQQTYQRGERRGVIFNVNDHVELEFFEMDRQDAEVCVPPMNLSIKFMVDDVDAEFTRLQTAGLHIFEPLMNHPWGERAFGVYSPDGLKVFVFSKLIRDA